MIDMFSYNCHKRYVSLITSQIKNIELKPHIIICDKVKLCLRTLIK